MAVLEYLKISCGDISDAAWVSGINRPGVHDNPSKQATGDLRDRPRVAGQQPNKTPARVEQQVIDARNKTRTGPERLSNHLAKCEKINVPAGTIRHILRRNRSLLIHSGLPARHRRQKREFVDWYTAATGDPDFGGGSDRITYAIGLGAHSGPYTVSARLPYPAVSYPYAPDLQADHKTPMTPSANLGCPGSHSPALMAGTQQVVR